MKILYLEDNISDFDLTQRAILKVFPNYILHNVGTIAETKKVLQKENEYDLLLLDLHLPDGNGMDLLFSIREKNIPIAVIVLTGANDEEIAITALKAGADDYLSKSRGYLKNLPETINQAVKNFKKRQKSESKTIQILYVEWYEADIELTKIHLNKFAPYFQIKTVFNADEALNLLPKSNEEQNEFDILLMDYHLPGINAIEAVKQIRRERKLSIPIVLVTGQGNEEIAIQALKLGADEYIVKRENYLTRLPSILLSAYQKHQLVLKQIELERSKAEYKSFFDDDLTGDFIVTIDGKLLNCNSAYLKICGFSSKEEALNYDIKKLYSKIGERDTLIERLKKEGTVISYEVNLTRLDGKMIDVVGNLVGGYNSHGDLITLKGYIFDETEKKRAVERLRKLSQAVEQSPATILITDLKGNIEYVNKKFTEVTGYSFEEVIGKNPRIFKSGHQSKDFYETMWKTITSGEDWFGEILNLKKDKSSYWEQASISSIKNADGKATHYLGIKEDITEKKNTETKLIKALEKAQESDQLKTAFLQNISHEIRTPMNAIIGFSNFLLNPDLSFEKREKYVNIITESSKQLLSIITDIIHIASIEAGQEKLVENELKLNPLLNLIYEQFNENALAKNIDFTLTCCLPDDEDSIITDSSKLVEVITNLVGNALKFTHKGFVNFGCKVTKNQLEFYVKDSGIGIPNAMQSDIFNRFNQVERTVTRQYGGSGLGLSISKSYVELMGGSIKLESTEGIGSTFSFAIPYKTKNEQKTDFVELEIPSLKILIVEDDLITQQYLEELLIDVSKEIQIADNGYKALDFCRENSDIDLILMDIKMPGINGFEVAKQIRQFNKEVIIILQTAFTLSGDKEKGIEAGCNDYLSKPIKKEELFEKINKNFKK